MNEKKIMNLKSGIPLKIFLFSEKGTLQAKDDCRSGK
jgi:hypothetical protein